MTWNFPRWKNRNKCKISLEQNNHSFKQKNPLQFNESLFAK